MRELVGVSAILLVLTSCGPDKPAAPPAELNQFLPCPPRAQYDKAFSEKVGAEMERMQKEGGFDEALKALRDYHNEKQ